MWHNIFLVVSCGVILLLGMITHFHFPIPKNTEKKKKKKNTHNGRPVTPPKRIGVGDHFFSYDVVRYYVKGLPFFIRSASSLCCVWGAVSKLVDEGRGGLLSPVWWWGRPLCIIIIAIEFVRPFVRKLHSWPRRNRLRQIVLMWTFSLTWHR